MIRIQATFCPFTIWPPSISAPLLTSDPFLSHQSDTGSSSGIVSGVGGGGGGGVASLTSLKLRVFRLEQMLREKEEEVRRLKADTRTARLKEMKLQVQVYYREVGEMAASGAIPWQEGACTLIRDQQNYWFIVCRV